MNNNPDIDIYYPFDAEEIGFAANRIAQSLDHKERGFSQYHISSYPDSDSEASIVVADSNKTSRVVESQISKEIDREGYLIKSIGENKIYVRGGGSIGAMYGLLKIEEELLSGASFNDIKDRKHNPDNSFRAIKFNLPWSPYRAGEQNDFHINTCRNLEFWDQFLDMMAVNRFNILSLWNLHPFMFMVQSESFPESCPFTDEELSEWKSFWHSLFEMANKRGIDVYIVNWNIVVPPTFANAYDVQEYGSTAEIVKQYTQDIVTKTINEYENLTGLGVTLADWMNNLNAQEKQNWLQDTIVEGIKQADRSIKFLDRSVLTESINEMRRVIDDVSSHEKFDEVSVPTKFNWSHGHSTSELELTHDYSTGEVDETLWSPEPENYELTWMIRNEDFFVLRWGDSEFVREHIRTNSREKDYVNGYFVGSEGFIPAKDYSHKRHKHQTWEYAFEKHWLFYTLWGRLLYNVETPDKVFQSAFDRRYGPGIGTDLFKAYKLASRMPLRLASFHASTWDYTLYSEGFLAPEPTPFSLDKRRKAMTGKETESIAEQMHQSFISIDDLIYHESLGSNLLSIPDYIDSLLADNEPTGMTPTKLAENLSNDGRKINDIVDDLTRAQSTITIVDGFHLDTHDEQYNSSLECELSDIKVWAYLSMYFSEKLRAGVALEHFRHTGQTEYKSTAISLLENAANHWEQIIAITTDHYTEHPYRKDETFSWEKYQPDVEKDIELARRAKPVADLS